MTDAQVKGDMDAVMSYMHEFYFESAAMILTLITVGKCWSTLQGQNDQCSERADEPLPENRRAAPEW